MSTVLNNPINQILASVWKIQATWFIDPISGLDSNSGLSGSSLKTWAELYRRMVLCGGPNVNVTITILSDLPSSDPLLSFDCFTGAIQVTVIGTPTIVRSSSFTSAPTARNSATNTPNDITDSTVSDWTSDIGVASGRILMMTSGTASDTPAWIVKNLGSNKARTSPFYNNDDFTEKNPSSGDTYQIQQLTKVPAFNITPIKGIFEFKLLDFGDSSFSFDYRVGPGSGTFGVSFTYCAIYYLGNENTNVFLNNCALKNSPNLFTGSDQMYAGTIGDEGGFGAGEMETAGCLLLFNGTLIQGVGIPVSINFGYLRISDAQVFDNPSNGALVVGQTGFCRIDKVSGSGNAGWGLNISNSGCVMATLSQCTVTGTLGDVLFCGVVYTWATIQAMGGVESAKGMGYLLNNNQVETPIASKIGPIAIVTSIDLKATGQTTLFTVPTGKTLHILDVLIEITAVSVFATAAVVQVGKTAAFNQWAALKTLTGLNAVGLEQSLAAITTGPRATFAADDVVSLDVQTGAGATTLTAKAHLIGYLI
jgi:hypothetical protein